MEPVDLHTVASYCRGLGCDVLTRSAIERAPVMIRALAHVEDARPGDLCWYRGFAEPPPFDGSALVAHAGEFALPEAPLLVTSANPRRVLGELIDRFNVERAPMVDVHPLAYIHPHASIGADGQGYTWTGEGWLPFPHVGGVRIDEAVEIGPRTTIMRGSIGDTTIEQGCKVGNGVNIGHDTRVGEHTLIVAGAQLAGWVRVGRRCKIWQGALIKNGVRIGDEAVVGMGAVVLEDVPAGETWAGNPARRIR